MAKEYEEYRGWTLEEIEDMAKASGEPLPDTTPVRCMTIHEPWVERADGKATLKCRITVEDVEQVVFFTVDEEYGDYLCHERSDAFLIALVN